MPRSLIENVSDLQKEELKLYASYTLDGRSGRVFDAEYAGLRIPTFEDILRKLACHTVMNVHIKHTDFFIYIILLDFFIAIITATQPINKKST